MDLTGIGSVADFASTLVKRIFPPKMTDAEKAIAQIQLQEMLEKLESSLVDAQKAIIVSEMQQGDNYTKRARPSIVYFGLAAIGLVHVLLPVVAWLIIALTDSAVEMPDIALPVQFWATWGGVCGIWIIGRSVERRGVTGKLVKMITGAK